MGAGLAAPGAAATATASTTSTASTTGTVCAASASATGRRLPRAPLPRSYLGYLLLNLPGIYDEAIILVLFAKWLGPKEVMYSAQHFYQQYVTPYTKPYTDQIAEKLGKAKSD